MFLKNIFQFLKGYVIIVLTGNSIWHFLNICMHRKIKLQKAEYMPDGNVQVLIDSADFKKLRSIARKTGTHVNIKKKCGVKILRRRYGRRIFMVGGFIVFVLFVAIFPRFIWCVDVDGAQGEMRDEIIKVAAVAGVKPGALKSRLPDGNEMKGIILSNTDNLTWAWVYLKGTKAVISVRTAIQPPEVIDKSQPCDIVSGKDGIIKKITVKDGIALVKKGDIVLENDTLITGTLNFTDGEYRLKHALGEVRAETFYKKSAKIKLFRDVRNKTGRKKKYTDITFFSKAIPLYKNVNVEYKEYSLNMKHRDLAYGIIPFSVVTNIYEEENVKRIPINEEEAAEAAKYELEKEISENLFPLSEITGENIDVKYVDEETLEVTLSMSFTEKIGKEVPIKYNDDKQE